LVTKIPHKQLTALSTHVHQQNWMISRQCQGNQLPTQDPCHQKMMPQQIAEKPCENQEQKDKTKWLLCSKVKKLKMASIKVISVFGLLAGMDLLGYQLTGWNEMV